MPNQHENASLPVELDGGEFLEARAFVVAAKRAFGKKVHGEQDARQKRKERECEFPE